MKSRPILFSGPMVRAILEWRKTQTRREVKSFREFLPALNAEFDCIKDWDGHPSRLDIAPVNWEICPYGQPGDRLWVRESWRTVECADSLPPRELNAAHRIWLEADAPHQPGYGKLRPGMFMPRWASRITLEVTRTSVERLQDIDANDCIAEGIDGDLCAEFTTRAPSRANLHPAEYHAYAGLWDKINGAGAWDKNPWVWVIEFKAVTKEPA